MKLIRIFLAAAVLSTVTVVQAQTPEEAVAKYNEAAQLINDKQFEAAIPLLDEAVSIGLDVGDAAIETVQKAQKLLPRAYFYAGGSHLMAGDYAKALEYFQQAAGTGELYGDLATARKANGYVAQVYTAMAAEAFNNKDYAKAAEIFAQGYAVNPRDTELALNLAMSYCEMGEMEKGEKVYKEVIALGENPKYAEAAATAREKVGTYLSIAAKKEADAGNLDAAYATIDCLLAIDPTNAAGQLMRIQLANNAKQYDKVIEWGAAAAEAQPDEELRSSAYMLLGAAYQNTNRKDEAIAAYQKVTTGESVTLAKEQIAELSK